MITRTSSMISASSVKSMIPRTSSMISASSVKSMIPMISRLISSMISALLVMITMTTITKKTMATKDRD
jgi:hypothetical protein